MDRRAFLSILAGSPLIFGLRELSAQEPASDVVDAALKRMKETRRYGVLLVIPADKEARNRLGRDLIDRLPSSPKSYGEGFELFFGTVFLCVDEARAKDFSGGKVEGVGIVRILLDPSGKRVEEDRVTWETLEHRDKFLRSFLSFVHGAGDARLRDHARAIEKDMPEELKKAATRLHGSPEESAAAAATLKAAADAIAPWLVHKVIEGGSTFALLQQHFREQTAKDPDPTLPFGVRVERVRTEDPCPPCGMAAYPPTSYRFLSFYTR
jgi:hypothetical protein